LAFAGVALAAVAGGLAAAPVAADVSRLVTGSEST
jgi:hypothetical protein